MVPQCASLSGEELQRVHGMLKYLAVHCIASL